jgi:ABC-type uncharacterized transport system permease subunit
MTESMTIAAIGGVGFALAGVASYAEIRRQQQWAVPVIRVAAGVALLAGIIHLGWAVGHLGLVTALQSNFNATMLMSVLVGLVGFSSHVSAKLRGLDGFLFLAAAVLCFTGITQPDAPPADATHRPWFISHALAFAISTACFVAGGAAGMGYLLVSRMLRRKRATAMVGTVAPLESLERFGRWMPLLGFPLFTYGILTGLCGVAHRQDLRVPSRPAWYLDPTLIVSIAAWAVYAYLCIASLHGSHVRGRRAAMLSTYGLGLVLVAFVVREFSWLHQ